MDSKINLDKICAQYGMELLNKFFDISQKSNSLNDSLIKDKINDLLEDIKKFETEINKALGILVEDGPFAFIIWLKSQDKEPHRAILIQTARILKEVNLLEINTDEDLKEKIENAFIENISIDIKKLLLVKTILEKMLIYARYKAKAMQNK